MSDEKTLVAFTFGWVRKQPGSARDLNQDSWFKLQAARIRSFAKKRNARIVKVIWDATTSRKKAFAFSDKFLEAVATAADSGADLVLADITELLSRSPKGSVGNCAQVLDNLQVVIWDAARDRTWISQGDERRVVEMLASYAQLSRSQSVKAGIGPRSREKKPPPPENGLRGNIAARRNADAFAKRHAGFVKSEAAKLAPGKKLSPTSLARALNDAGIPARRGGRWTHNAVKDLLKRQRALGMLRD